MTLRRRLHTLAILTCAAHAQPARPTVVMPMTVQKMADAAAQVIDGVVEDVSGFRSDDGTTIRTRVRFVQTDYLKGRLPDSTNVFELVVPGGRIGDQQLRLTGAPQFVVGDRWLLFLHPTYNIHPVVGIHCGALRMIADSRGDVRVHDCQGKPVIGINRNGFLRTINSAATSSQRIQIGAVSHGVTPIDVPAQAEVPAMPVEQFIDLLSPILANSRLHALDVPAGRLLRKTVVGVPLSIRGGPDQMP